MTELEIFYNKAKEIVLAAVPGYWPEMKLLMEEYVNRDMLAEIITPASACRAVGSDMCNTYEISAAILAGAISMRILDDLQDNDKPEALYNKIGLPRTLNYVDAFRTIAYKILCDKCVENNGYLKIMQEFTTCYLVVLAGQDSDLKPAQLNFDAAWKTIEMKTGYIHATAAAIGAMAGTDNKQLITACKNYGYHLGLAIQIFNDMDGIWNAEGISDIKQNKITLPIIYALNCEHTDKQTLLEIVNQNTLASNSNIVIEILNNVDAKGYLLWAALQQREKAFDAISILPANEGTEMLKAFFNGIFGDIENLAVTDAIINEPKVYKLRPLK
ncbi:hypothetical protein BH11BAC3_BH11BAC3_18210 [soil metagenome]